MLFRHSRPPPPLRGVDPACSQPGLWNVCFHPIALILIPLSPAAGWGGGSTAGSPNMAKWKSQWTSLGGGVQTGPASGFFFFSSGVKCHFFNLPKPAKHARFWLFFLGVFCNRSSQKNMFKPLFPPECPALQEFPLPNQWLLSSGFQSALLVHPRVASSPPQTVGADMSQPSA